MQVRKGRYRESDTYSKKKKTGFTKIKQHFYKCHQQISYGITY